MVPTEWQVRTVLRDCKAKAKDPAQAPQYRQLQNLTSPGRADLLAIYQKNLTADVHHAIIKCESLGSEKQLILHRNPPAIAWEFSPFVAVLRRHFFAQCCTSLQGVYCLGAPLENPFKTNWREGLSCCPGRLFQHRIRPA